MGDLRDLIRLKKDELQQVKNRINLLQAEVDAMKTYRDALVAEINELQAWVNR